ncbi:unnamed protein product [Closterium sp. NIES-64]|nr:unnamed protein product [Closterium sp. NIES-64]
MYTAFRCALACSLQLIGNGVCNPECNTPTCAFDGGDCGCIDPVFGVGFCTCPAGQARCHDGCAPLSLPRLPSIPSCCVSDAVGDNLSYPLTLQRYGPNFWESNRALAAERDAPLTRFVASHNRLLIGMFLRQHCWSVKTCQSSRLHHLAGWCSNGTSRQPFGVNAHYLPSSSLFNPVAAAATSTATTAPQAQNASSQDQLVLNPQGLPYGFVYPVQEQEEGYALVFEEEQEEGYPLVFDVNLAFEDAMSGLHYLADDFYIDNATRSIEDSHVVATSITHDFGTILRYLINRSLGRFSPYSDNMGRLEQLGARNKQQDEAHKRMQRYQSFKRRAKSCLGGKVCGGGAAEVERAKTMAASGGGVVAPQRVLQVKGQSIDDISLAMILQRRHAREDPSASLPSPSSASVLQISPESEQLSHVLLRQFGDHVVRDYSRPQHKPKHGLPQVQKELGKVREAMDELKAMVLALHSAVTAGEGMLPAAAAGAAGVGGSAAGGARGYCPLFSASSSAAAVLARSSFSTTSFFSTAQGCFLSPNSLGTPLGTPLGTSPARDPFSSPAASSLAASSPFIRNPFAAGNPLVAGHPFATNNPFAGGNPFGTGSPQHHSLVLQRGAARRAGSAGRAGLRGSMGPSNLGRGNQASRQGNGLMLSRVETTPLPHRHSLDGAASGRHGGSGADSHADGSQQLTYESVAFVHADTMPMPRTRTSSFPYPEPEPRDAQAGSAQAPGSSDGESADGDGKGSASGEEQSEELSPLTQAARRVSLSEMEEEGGGRMRKRGGEGSNGRGASGAGGSWSVRKSVGFREV